MLKYHEVMSYLIISWLINHFNYIVEIYYFVRFSLNFIIENYWETCVRYHYTTIHCNLSQGYQTTVLTTAPTRTPLHILHFQFYWKGALNGQSRLGLPVLTGTDFLTEQPESRQLQNTKEFLPTYKFGNSSWRLIHAIALANSNFQTKIV